MKSQTRMTLIFLAALTTSLVYADNHQSVRAQVAERTEQWMDLWNAGRAPLDRARFERYAELFAAPPNNYLAIDDFTGEVLVIRGYDAYIETWAPVMEGFESWSIKLAGHIDVDASGDTAIASFKFRGSGVLKDGEGVLGFTYATLVWRLIDDEWRLVHEHLTGSSS